MSNACLCVVWKMKNLKSMMTHFPPDTFNPKWTSEEARGASGVTLPSSSRALLLWDEALSRRRAAREGDRHHESITESSSCHTVCVRASGVHQHT